MSLASALAEAMAPRCFVPGCNRPSVWHELCVLHAAEEVAAEVEIAETNRIQAALLALEAEEDAIAKERPHAAGDQD